LTLRFDGPLVVATHNPGKVREIADLLRPFGIETKSAAELGLPEPEETGTSFAANAELKARAAAEASGHVALADDSGLAVEGLGGAPGIYSARWAETGRGRDFGHAMARVKAELKQAGVKPPWHAAFRCVLALAWPSKGAEKGDLKCFEGRVAGYLTFPPKGERGFGYDPIFVADGRSQTFGEMDPEAKHAISHRADAFRKLVAACQGR
jgi:XTP/dITP diphosphohydrolase